MPSARRLAFLSLALLTGAVAATTGWAAVIAVTDCGDSGAPNQLRTIMNDAATQSGDTILLPACTITLEGTAGEDGNLGGDLDVFRDVRIQGAGPGLSVLDGAQNDRVIDVRLGVTAVLSGLTVRNGRVVGSGGGIFNVGFLTLINVLLTGNHAVSQGGAITIGGGVVTGNALNVLNSTIANNEAGDGGGIGAGLAGPMTLQNVTISGNRAIRNGGGIALPANPAMVVLLVNTTITGNTADSDNAANNGNSGVGGGIHVGFGAQVTIRNTVVAGNALGTSPGAVGPDCLTAPMAPPIVAEGVNLIQSLASCSTSGTVLSLPPGLGPLAANGGPTPTHALLADSPAIDAGDDGVCTTADQRGAARPADGNGDGGARCDLGAYEVAAAAASVAFPDFDGDGRADVVVAQGPGGAGNVRVLSGATGTVLLDLFPFGTDVPGGVAVTACQLSGSGGPDLVVSAGSAARVEVRVLDGVTGEPREGPLGALQAYAGGTGGSRAGFRGPASVACADVNGDGVLDIVTGPPAGGPGGAPVRLFSGLDGTLLREDVPFDPAFRGGVFVAP